MQLSTYSGTIAYQYNTFDQHIKEISFGVIDLAGADKGRVLQLVRQSYPDKLALAMIVDIEFTEKPFDTMRNPPDELGALV